MPEKLEQNKNIVKLIHIRGELFSLVISEFKG